MMQPQIRYVKSADGTRIAVWTLGEGRPLIVVPNILTRSIEGYMEVSDARGNLERLAERRKVALYDCRGVGLSSRDVEDFSTTALQQDLEAVADVVDSPIVDIFAIPLSGPVAISFAAYNPDRVRKLVLWGSAARGRDIPRSTELRDIRGLIDSNWNLYLQNLALITYGWTEEGRQWAQSLATDLSRETYLKAMQVLNSSDVTELLPELRCQMLVMHRRGQEISADREMTAAIPGARMMTLSQNASWIWGARDWDSTLAPLVAFLDEGSEAIEAPSDLPSGTAVILFADIVDSTGLTERLGDDAFRKKARGLDEAMRAAIRDNGGTAVEGKTLGDGVLAVFTSAKEAIGCARACHEAAGAAGLALHAGIHAGDVIREADNVYGGAVNIAARVAAASAAGETLVSGTVRELARTSAGVVFEDRGEQALKGIDGTVRVWAVREGGA